MVTRANRPGLEVGGHIATYQSVATLYEVGLNHFFRGKDHPGGGDQIYFQGHASPGVYARCLLEGRLIDRPARRVPPGGVEGWGQRALVLPAPAADARLWEFPTVSMGIASAQLDLPGPLQPLPAQPRHHRHDRPARLDVPRRRRDGRTRVARWRSPSPPGEPRQPHRSSSTATSSSSTARSAATARSCRSSSRCSEAPNWNVIKLIWGIATGTRCSPRTPR